MAFIGVNGAIDGVVNLALRSFSWRTRRHQLSRERRRRRWRPRCPDLAAKDAISESAKERTTAVTFTPAPAASTPISAQWPDIAVQAVSGRQVTP